MLLSESKICKNIKKKSRCKLKHRRKRWIQTIHGLFERQAAVAVGWAEGRHHCALLSSSSHLSLCFRLEHSATWNARPLTQKGLKAVFDEAIPHHFPSQERRSTVLGVTAAVHLSEVASETHLHPTRGKNGSQSPWPSSSQKEGMTREEVPDPEACPPPLWASQAQHTISQLPHPPYQPEASTLHTLIENAWAQIPASATADHWETVSRPSWVFHHPLQEHEG